MRPTIRLAGGTEAEERTRTELEALLAWQELDALAALYQPQGLRVDFER